jgi:SAM-dependent methyltransferase
MSSIVTNPIHICISRLRALLASYIQNIDVRPGDKWLDVGCGQRPYEVFFPPGSYTGVDVHSSGSAANDKKADIYYDGIKLPFDDSTFSGVICTQVLEHVQRPRELVSEIYRVLRPNGWFVFSVPFVWQEHEEPYDFFRYSKYGISELISGFTLLSQKPDSGAVETIALLINMYVMGNIVPPVRFCSTFVAVVFCFPLQILAILLRKLLKDNGKLYLNLVCLARKNSQPRPATR